MGYPYTYPDGESECCGAPMMHGICLDCGEHAEQAQFEEDEEDRPSPMQEINRLADDTRAAMFQPPPMFTALGGDVLSRHNDLIERDRQDTKGKGWHPHGYDGLD